MKPLSLLTQFPSLHVSGWNLVQIVPAPEFTPASLVYCLELAKHLAAGRLEIVIDCGPDQVPVLHKPIVSGHLYPQ